MTCKPSTLRGDVIVVLKFLLYYFAAHIYKNIRKITRHCPLFYIIDETPLAYVFEITISCIKFVQNPRSFVVDESIRSLKWHSLIT